MGWDASADDGVSPEEVYTFSSSAEMGIDVDLGPGGVVEEGESGSRICSDKGCLVEVGGNLAGFHQQLLFPRDT
jgi:hypothetical protein